MVREGNGFVNLMNVAGNANHVEQTFGCRWNVIQINTTNISHCRKFQVCFIFPDNPFQVLLMTKFPWSHFLPAKRFLTA